MGQSHTTETASDTETETIGPQGPPTHNFFGLFGSKKNEYIDSTDSEISLEESRRNRRLSEPQKKNKARRISRSKHYSDSNLKREGKTSSQRANLRNKSPEKAIVRNNNSNKSNYGGVPRTAATCKTDCDIPARKNPHSEPQPNCKENTTILGNTRCNSNNNSRFIGDCRHKTREKSPEKERKEDYKEKGPNKYYSSGHEVINRIESDNKSTHACKKQQYLSGPPTNKTDNQAVNVICCVQETIDSKPPVISEGCADTKYRKRSCLTCTCKNNAIPPVIHSSTESIISKHRYSPSVKNGNNLVPFQEKRVLGKSTTDVPCPPCDNIAVKCSGDSDPRKNINGICVNRCDSKSDKPELTAVTKGASATTIDSDVMNDYPRYSREPPEREHNSSNFAHQNKRSCCRGCCEPNNFNNKPVQSTNYQSTFPSNRPISDPYVTCNQSFQKVDPSQSRSSPIGPHKGSSGRFAPDPHPEIPSPPPPPIKDCYRRSRQSSFVRSPPPPAFPNTDNGKQMYNPHNYNYHKQHYKNSYPYEEPPESFSHSRETCCSNNCGGYEHCPQHKRCKCRCSCEPDTYYPRPNVSEDQLSCSESTKTDFMNLAYQRTGDYPELVDELENTLSQRNRIRVQKTMAQFEKLSRQNKNLARPIFDDEESLHNHHKNSKDCKCACCKEYEHKDSRKSYNKSDDSPKSRPDSHTRRSSFPASSFPRKSGYVEKVARCMDPNLNRKRGNYVSPPRYSNQKKNTNQGGGGNCGWQMDSRKGEWIRVNNNGQYDFENNYPPLPPPPRSGHVHEEAPNRREYSNRNSDMDQSCSCNKCSRHNR